MPSSSSTWTDLPRLVARSVALSLALAPAELLACPCQVQGGPSSALTGPGDRWAVGSSLSLLRELGTWDHRGRARPEPDAVRVDRALWELSLAQRPHPRMELTLSSGVNVTLLDQPGVTHRALALGDTLARARWEALPSPTSLLSSAALTFALRIPTGDAGRDPAAALGGTLGLGAWEGALGLSLRRRLGARFETVLDGELALRAPSTTPSGSTALGPRVLASAGVSYLPSLRVAVSLHASLWWEGAPSVEGQRLPDADVRRATVTLSGVYRDGEHLRWTASLALDPPIDHLGANASASLRATLGLAWTR